MKVPRRWLDGCVPLRPCDARRRVSSKFAPKPTNGFVLPPRGHACCIRRHAKKILKCPEKRFGCAKK
eukprot:5285587-Prymnesium_polylepis.1